MMNQNWMENFVPPRLSFALSEIEWKALPEHGMGSQHARECTIVHNMKNVHQHLRLPSHGFVWRLEIWYFKCIAWLVWLLPVSSRWRAFCSDHPMMDFPMWGELCSKGFENWTPNFALIRNIMKNNNTSFMFSFVKSFVKKMLWQSEPQLAPRHKRGILEKVNIKMALAST